MRASCAAAVFALLNGSFVQSFTMAPKRSFSKLVSSLSSTPNDEAKEKRAQEILAEEANNPTNMKKAAEAMKNLKPEDMDRMLEEIDKMNPLQKAALKGLGMDPEAMKKTMKMMVDNPAMVESAQKLMENMSPAELLEQSRAAQKRLNDMTPEALEETSRVMSQIPQEQLDQAVEIMKEQQTQTKEADAPSVGPTSDDKEVIDSMFRVAELMSEPATGGCTFAGFSSLPVIQLLSGDREFDLSPKEFRECWAGGALGASRVDRQGFERVWNEVQDYFEDDIMGEARKEAKKRIQKKVRASNATSAPRPTTTIGEGLNSDQLKDINERVKDMSETEVDAVLDQMDKMGPAEEARMRSMGVDPSLLKRTAELMKGNPAMRKACEQMIKDMSPEQMLEASKQAQQQMQGMSKEEIEKLMDANRKL